MQCNHSIIACSCHIFTGVILHAHPVCGESHIQCNTNGEVATTSPPFYNKPHRSHILFVKAAPGTTFTSWSQHHFVAIGKPGVKCMKLDNVTASNTRDRAPLPLYYCLFVPHIYGCYSSHTSRSW